MAVSIAVALREHAIGVGGIDHAVGGRTASLLLDVVVHRVNGLAGIDSMRVVPIQAVVSRADVDRCGEVVPAS